MKKQSNSETEASTTETVNDGQQSETQEQTSQTPTIEQLQADLDAATKRISELNHESADRRKRLEAHEKAAKEQQELEMSAQERLTIREGELAELTEATTAQAKQLEAMKDVLEKQYSATVTSLEVPTYVQEAIKDRPVSERLDFINDYREEFSRSGRGLDLSGGKDGKASKVRSLKDLKGKSPEEINAAWESLKK